MRAALALIRFELERRWMAFAGGLFGGLFVYLLPVIRDTATGPNDIRSLAVAVATATLVVVYSIALGGSLLANDLAERRGSFLFGRPIGGAAIAAGRFVAVLLVVVGSGALATLPSLLGGVRLEFPTFGYEFLETPALAALYLAGAIALLLLSSAVSLSARARTAWIVLELAALVGGGLLVGRGVLVLRELFLETAVQFLFLGIALAAAAALGAIYLAAGVSGRTDLRRAHRAQACVWATLCVASGLAAFAWASDYVSPSFDEVLDGAQSSFSMGEGQYVIVGSENGRDELATAFLFDGNTGRSHRAGQLVGSESWGLDLVQRGGGFYFWPRRRAGEVQIERGAFDANGFDAEPTALEFDRVPAPWAVSNDGARFVGLRSLGRNEGSLLEVYEIVTGRLLQSTRLPALQEWNSRLEPEGDGFRLVAWSQEIDWTSWRIDRDGSATITARSAMELDSLFWILDGERRRLFLRVRTDSKRGWLVLDAASLERVALLTPPLLAESESSIAVALALYPDGSIGTTARTTDRRELTLFSARGEPLHSSIWPRSGVTHFAGSGAEHTLLLASRSDEGGTDRAAGWTVDRFDLATGERRTVARDLLPIASPPLGRSGSLLLRDASGALHALDPDSGALTKLPDVR